MTKIDKIIKMIAKNALGKSKETGVEKCSEPNLCSHCSSSNLPHLITNYRFFFFPFSFVG